MKTIGSRSVMHRVYHLALSLLLVIASAACGGQEGERIERSTLGTDPGLSPSAAQEVRLLDPSREGLHIPQSIVTPSGEEANHEHMILDDSDPEKMEEVVIDEMYEIIDDDLVSFEGTVRVIISESFHPPRSVTQIFLEDAETGRQREIVFGAQRRPTLRSGDWASFEGNLLEDDRVLAETDTLQSYRPSAAIIAEDPGAGDVEIRERMIVIPVQVEGKRRLRVCDADRMQDILFGEENSVAAGLSEASEGRVHLSGTVVREPVRVPDTQRECDFAEWSRLAWLTYRHEHGLRGVQGYNRVAYIVPGCSDWAGRAEVSQFRQFSRLWVTDESSCSVPVFLHELGHAQGLTHGGMSHRMCRKYAHRNHHVCREYGDVSTYMGHSIGEIAATGLNAPNLFSMGWRLESMDTYEDLDTRYQLRSLDREPADEHTQFVRISGRDGTPDQFVSYRTREGRSERLYRPLADRVHVTSWRPGENTKLVAVLKRGQSYRDPERGVMVTFLRGAGGSADAQVRLSPYGHPVGRLVSGARYASRAYLTGYAYDPDLGRRSVEVRVFVNDQEIGRTRADKRHHQRLVDGSRPRVSGRHGFELLLSNLPQNGVLRLVVPNYDAEGEVVDDDGLTIGPFRF